MAATATDRPNYHADVPIELRSWWYEEKLEPGDNPQSYYSGWILELVVDGRVYGLGRNDKRPRVVNFYGTQAVPTPQSASPYPEDVGEVQRMGGGVPYDDPIFVKAARWLLDQPGIEKLKVFTQDPEYPGISFVPVDPQRLTEAGLSAAIQRRRLLIRREFEAAVERASSSKAMFDHTAVRARLPPVDDASFSAEVLGSSKPVLVNFQQLHNPGSEALTPVLERIAAAHGHNLTIVSVDADENPTTIREQKITSIPTAVVYVEGQPVKRIEGSWTEPSVYADLADYL